MNTIHCAKCGNLTPDREILLTNDGIFCFNCIESYLEEKEEEILLRFRLLWMLLIIPMIALGWFLLFYLTYLIFIKP